MMMDLCCDVIKALGNRMLVTAESCTGGGIGAALTSVAGASSVYLGGIICYCNAVKIKQLGVPKDMLEREGAVSACVAQAMAVGARQRLEADVAVSVTGLAGPSGDEFDNPVGTVYIGYADRDHALAKKYLFTGCREEVRNSSIEAALKLILSILNLQNA